MHILHGIWFDDTFFLWAESVAAFETACANAAPALTGEPDSRAHDSGAVAVAERIAIHPFACSASELQWAVASFGLSTTAGEMRTVSLRLPSHADRPQASARLATAADTFDELPHEIQSWETPCCSLASDDVVASLLKLESASETDQIKLAHDLEYWFAVSRMALELVQDQRFVPSLYQDGDGHLRGCWQPWLHDEDVMRRINALASSMPGIARSADEHVGRPPWLILDQALRSMTDSVVRRALIEDDFKTVLDDRDSENDSIVAWLSGLLDASDKVPASGARSFDMLTDIRGWLARPLDTGQSRPYHLALRLVEPERSSDTNANDDQWTLGFYLHPQDESEELISAESIWSQSYTAARQGAHASDNLHEALLAELSRAAGIYPLIDDVLADSQPTSIPLTLEQAYTFLREDRPVLLEAGFDVIAPDWWDSPVSQIGVHLQIDSDEIEGPQDSISTPGGAQRFLGLRDLVRFQWRFAVGDQTLSLEEFERLSRERVPLVRIENQWIEVRPDDLAAVRQFVAEHGDGEGSLVDAMRLAFGTAHGSQRVPILGVQATGWVSQLFSASEHDVRLPELDPPRAFHGTLRPYQLTGMRWLLLLDQLGIGACLADDMGLGKTIQLIALLQIEREDVPKHESLGPTLLVAPTSVISNWSRELQRFSPELTFTMHHGADRATGQAFIDVAQRSDLVITTYGLVARDLDSINRVTWRRVVLDEAQFIKNPPTKQASAIRSLNTDRRIALTGTPVENRLTELWSIMEFCNPGSLGTSEQFRRSFAIPIEKHRESDKAQRLRQLIQPFVLRRLKTDANVISDLPACVETREYASLTDEQASLYEQMVQQLLGRVDGIDGIQRRGVVLAALVKLKQICNHPAQFLRETQDQQAIHTGDRLVHRSGKCQRLIELLEEVLAVGDKALVFTQFRQMGHLLTTMIRQSLDVEAIFMHGGTPQKKRQEIIDRFQSSGDDVPVFVLSLRAGGFGLNLTAANHVFHFDRWWNPAVENQATDRAFRIGQTRNVHVHKFVCSGTLEERIDEMIQRKTELAENIVGSGEDWVTEFTSAQLRDLLTLRRSAIEDDP